MHHRPGVFLLTNGGRSVDTTNTVCLRAGNFQALGCNVTKFRVKGVMAYRCGKCGQCDTGASKGSTLMGLSTHSNFVCRKCLCNGVAAATTRHCLAQLPCSAQFVRAEEAFQNRLLAYTGHYDANPVLFRSVWERRYTQDKMRAIARSFVEDALDPTKWTAMLKREGGNKMPTKPRLIQFQKTKCTQAVVGPLFSAYQKAVAAAFHFSTGWQAHGIDVTFASGLNATGLSAWMEYVQQRGVICFYERDGEAWDASMNQRLCEFKERMAAIYSMRLADFIHESDTSFVSHRSRGGKATWSVRFTVKSGAGDTTTGNSLINAAIAFEVFSGLGVRCSILVAGDDLLVACYDDFDLDSVIAGERAFGIVPDAAKFVSAVHVSFCSAIWAYDAAGAWHYIPSPGRLFARLFWTCKPPARRHYAAYVRGVVKGLLPTCRDVPCLGPFLRLFDSEGYVVANDKAYHFRDAEYDTLDLRDWFCERYQLTNTQLLDFEHFLEGVQGVVGIIAHPTLAAIQLVDLADLQDRKTLLPVPNTPDFICTLPKVVRPVYPPHADLQTQAVCECAL